MSFKDRDKLQKIHLAEAVEGLKRYNARRKLKGAVQALAGAVSLDCTDSDSNKENQFNFFLLTILNFACHPHFIKALHSGRSSY